MQIKALLALCFFFGLLWNGAGRKWLSAWNDALHNSPEPARWVTKHFMSAVYVWGTLSELGYAKAGEMGYPLGRHCSRQ